MIMSRIGRSSLLLLLLPLAAANCEEEEIVRVKRELMVEPNPVNFQAVPIAQRVTKEVTLGNPTMVPIEITSCALSEDTEPAFSLGTCPSFLAPATSAIFSVSVEPVVEGELLGTVLLTTLDEDIGTVSIPLLAEGVDEGLPEIRVTPEALDFGPTAINDRGFANLEIQNVGVHDLYVRNVEVICPDLLGECPFTGILAGSLVDQAIAPTLTAQLRIAFLPPELGPFSGLVKITSNDPNRSVVEVPIEGSGHQPPVPEAVLVNDPENIEPLDQVVIDGRTSHSSVEGVGIETYHWSLIRRPDGSTATLRDADQSECGIIADLAGDYTVELHVVDTMGVRSVDPAIVSFRAVPADALHIQLTWDHPTADLDLHLIRLNPDPEPEQDDFTAFDPRWDAYFSNRFPDDWYQIQENHPRLDIDDQMGFGPENINIREPAEDTYQIWVHYWAANLEDARERRAPVEAVLRIYVMGLLQLETIWDFEEDQTMWKALQMDWPDLNFRTLEESMPYARPF